MPALKRVIPANVPVAHEVKPRPVEWLALLSDNCAHPPQKALAHPKEMVLVAAAKL